MSHAIWHMVYDSSWTYCSRQCGLSKVFAPAAGLWELREMQKSST